MEMPSKINKANILWRAVDGVKLIIYGGFTIKRSIKPHFLLFGDFYFLGKESFFLKPTNFFHTSKYKKVVSSGMLVITCQQMTLS